MIKQLSMRMLLSVLMVGEMITISSGILRNMSTWKIMLLIFGFAGIWLIFVLVSSLKESSTEGQGMRELLKNKFVVILVILMTIIAFAEIALGMISKEIIYMFIIFEVVLLLHNSTCIWAKSLVKEW